MRWARTLARLLAVGALGAATVAGCSCNFSPDLCKSDADCGFGNVCSQGFCDHVECRTDADCGNTRICTVSFQCRIGCRYDEDCGPGYACVQEELFSGITTCAPRCSADADCPQASVCVYGGCRAGCSTNADCAAHQHCSFAASPQDAGRAQADAAQDPFASLVARAEPPHCVSGCHDDSECPQGELCDQGACFEACRSDDECRGGSRCTSLSALGSFRASDAGVLLACSSGERCDCFYAGRRSTDGGKDATHGSAPDADASYPLDATPGSAPDGARSSDAGLGAPANPVDAAVEGGAGDARSDASASR